MPRPSLRPVAAIGVLGVLTVLATGTLTAAGSPAGAVTVRPGDTLWGIAQRYHVDLGRLADANGLRVNGLLLAGRVLVIPPPAPHGRTTGTSGWTSSPPSASDPSTWRTSASRAPTSGTVHVPSATVPHAGAAPAARLSPTATLTAAAVGKGPASRAGTPSPGYSTAQVAQMTGFCTAYRPPTGPAGGLPAPLPQSPGLLALRALFVKWSQAYGVPASLVEAIAWQESGWQNGVTSTAQAQGIGQLLPSTANFVSHTLLGLNLNLTVASDNIQMMSRFLAYLVQSTRGDVCSATAAYYEGLGTLDQLGVSPDAQRYVQSVLSLRLRFS